MPSLDDGSHSGADTTVTVAGWGNTVEGGSSPDVLHSVDLKLLTNAQCETYGYAGELADSMICAIGDLKGGEDSCQGDSGGPLFVQQARAFCLAPPHAHRRLGECLRVYPPSLHNAPLSLRPPDPFLGWSGRDEHHRRRCLVGQRLRAGAHSRRLHARVLLPSLDRGNAGRKFPAFVAASAAGDADRLRVLRRQYRMPLWWRGRFVSLWVHIPSRDY